jgi:DDE superfamily endonuclease
VRGLLAALPRKSCWTLAEHAGDPTPDGMQHLLAGAVWDADAVRDDVWDYALDHLGEPEAVLVVDESGDCKRAPTPWGCSPRQYTAMQPLADVDEGDEQLRGRVLWLLAELTRTGTPAIRSRGRKLLARLQRADR